MYLNRTGMQQETGYSISGYIVVDLDEVTSVLLISHLV
jgi:hypothetical protein